MRKKYTGLAVILAATMLATGCSADTVPDIAELQEQISVGVAEVQEHIGSEVGQRVDAVTHLVTSDQPVIRDTESDERYVYQTLDTETQIVYDELIYAVKNREEDMPVMTTNVDVLKRAYEAIRADHCELFWMGQLQYVCYTWNDEITSIEVSPEYTMTQEEQDAYQEQIDARVLEILAGAPAGGTDYDKALYVYETLINTVDYEVGSDQNQTIVSVFVNGKTVCQGYAYATQYLLEQLGIQCTTVDGYSNGESHAWNLVKLDGEYYYIDTTWGNSQFTITQEDQTDESTKYIDYNFFGATTESINLTHTFMDETRWPVCTATQDNYFIKEDLYVDSWDADTTGAMIARAYENGEPSVQIRFGSTEALDQAMEYFITDYHVDDYCPGLTQISYASDPTHAVMLIVF